MPGQFVISLQYTSFKRSATLGLHLSESVLDMTFSSGIKSSLQDAKLATLQVTLVLLLLGMTCCAASNHHVPAAPHMKVANNLKDGPLTVLDLPGCCSPCGDRDVVCPSVCVPCGHVVVKEGRVGTMESHVGPYPLPYLQIQEKEKVWCVEQSVLKLITAGVTLAVGHTASPSGCGPFDGPSLKASVSVPHNEKPALVIPTCLYLCNPDV